MTATEMRMPATTTTPEVERRRRIKSFYPRWFYLPAAILYIGLFAIPTFASFYFSMTRWSLFTVEFTGIDNFVQFFQQPALVQSFTNTLVYAAVTTALKIVLGLALALFLTSRILGRGYLRAVIFFPVLVSTIGVGLTFKALLDPYHGLVNGVLLNLFGIQGPGWLTDPHLALLTVAWIDVWKFVGIATLIFIAGIVAIPTEYFEAARVDGAGPVSIFTRITLPLARPAMATVIILSLIGGLRSFDLIWATTQGGPGYTSDVLASVIYKQYQAGFYGLSTAGNVILFVVVAAIMIPVSRLLNRKEVDA